MEQNKNPDSSLFNTASLGKWLPLLLALMLFFIMFPMAWLLVWYMLPWIVLGLLVFAFAYYGVAEKFIARIPNAYPSVSNVWKEVIVVFKKYIYRVIGFSFVSTALFIGSVFLYQYYTKEAKTISKLSRISVAIEKYKYDTGQNPATLNDLIAESPIRKEWRTDVWGNTILYQLDANGSAYQLTSIGRDGVVGSEDDIVLK